MSDVTSYTARWVLTAAGPPLEQGILTVRGDRIDAVEPKGSRRADVDLGNVALIPGLVNAHTHLDLSGATARFRRPIRTISPIGSKASFRFDGLVPWKTFNATFSRV
ncbi:MAG: hypothetical protein U0798_01405 [Gemmataceae bacterium]